MHENKHNWIFLRGLGREAAHWKGFLEHFQRSRPEAQTHCLDLPGTGKHYHLNSPVKLPGITDFVRQEGSEIAGPFFIVGISLGGMVALDWAQRFPKGCLGVIVINTSVGSLSPFYRRLQVFTFRECLKTLRLPSTERRETLALKLVSNRPEQRKDILAEWIQIQKQRPVSEKNLGRQLMAAASYRPALETLQVPGLILVSERDRMVHPKCSEDLHHLTNWPMKKHPWAGHDLPFEDPEWAVAAIGEWLDGFST